MGSRPGRPGKNLEPTRHIAVSSASVTPRPFRFGLQAMHAESRVSGGTWPGERRVLGTRRCSSPITTSGRDRCMTAAHTFLRTWRPSPPSPPQLKQPSSYGSAAGSLPSTFTSPPCSPPTTTLDLLSDGRLEVGIGAGVLHDEFEAMGIHFDEPKVRVDRLTEVVRLLKAHWSGQQIEISGEHVHVSGYAGLPAPVQKPHPPIMIGEKKRLLSLAGREAQIASVNFIPYVRTADGLTPWQEMARRLGTSATPPRAAR